MENKARIYGYSILINHFETELRDFLANEILEIGYGRKWIEGIPDGVINAVKRKSDKENFENTTEFLEYSDFIHLKEIALYKDNFKYCENFIGEISKDKFMEFMNELYSLRNKIAHADRNFSLLDLEHLVDLVNNLSKGPLASSIQDFIKLEKYRATTKIPSNFLEEKYDTKVISNLPAEDYDLEGGFVGRKEDRKKLKSLLYSDLDRVITVTGSGGVGKTALALNTAYKILDDPTYKYSAIIWFSAKTLKLTPESIVGVVPQIKGFEELIKKTFQILNPDVLNIVETIGSVEKTAEYLKRTFSESPVLLIIDNLETIMQDNDLIEFLKDVPNPSKVLITSRFGLGEVERRYPLKELSSNEAVHLFRLICKDKGLDTFIDLSQQQIERLVKQVNLYPLAIKWSIGKVAIGKDLEAAFKLPLEGTSDVARFCFEDIFSMLSEEAKKCLYGVSMFDEPPSYNLLSYLMDYKPDTFEKSIRELMLASLLFTQKEIKNENVITKYSLLSLTQDYVQEKLNQEKEIQTKLSSKFHQLTRLVEQEEKTISLRSHTIWRVGAKTQEDWIAVAKVRTAKQLEDMGNIQDAEEMYKDAERISPNFLYVLINFSQFLTSINKYNDADERMKKASEIEPGNFFVWYSWGVIKKKQNNTDEAQQYVEKALVLNPEDINTLIELGRILTFRGYYSESEPVLIKALKKETITQRQKMIALCHLSDNKRRWSESEFAKKNYNNLNKYFASAIKYVNEALELEPFNKKTFSLQKQIYLDYGIKLLQLGDKEKAKKYLKEVLKPTAIDGRIISADRSSQTLAYYNLALCSYKEDSKNIKVIDYFITKGLIVATDSRLIEKLHDLREKIEKETKKKFGRIVYVNQLKQYGLIESKGETCIFFRNNLIWKCKDLIVLKDAEVCFISTINPKNKKCQAIEIELIE